ncbi:MAG: RNase H family protein [Bacteroidales bacterium]
MIESDSHTINVFTDASFDPKTKTGTWAGIVLFNNKEKVLYDILQGVSQHGMELLSILECLEFIKKHYQDYNLIRIYTDSEYVENLPGRRDRLERNDFLTSKGNEIAHKDLLMRFYDYLDALNLEIERVVGHQKSGASIVSDYNRRVDKMSRKILRQKTRNR